MKFRKLRIAFSSLCAVLCVSLIVLWVQSYYWNVFLGKRLATFDLTFRTNGGGLAICAVSPLLPSPETTWSISRRPIARGAAAHLLSDDQPVQELLGFRYKSMPVGSMLIIPFWALLLPFLAAGALPWIKWRIGWRTAISAVCVLTTVLLIGLWMRGYEWIDVTDGTSVINVCSMNGKLFVGETFMIMGRSTLNPRAPAPASHLGICTLSPDKFELIPLGGGVALPYWLVVVVFAPIAAVPWLRWRFNLRTLLIATALVAIVLSLAVAALKR